MINTLLKELKVIAQSILDQEDALDLQKLENQVRALQKQITILEHALALSYSETEINSEVAETTPKEQQKAPEQTQPTNPNEETPASFDNLFSPVVSDPVFVKKETHKEEDNVNSENVPRNLNDKLGKGLKIGLNDRLAFIKNLFDESAEEYQRVISQILTYDDLEEAQNFIEKFVKPEYNSWEGKETFEERFYKIIEQNFN